MSDTIPLARPAVGEAEIAAAERVLRSGRLVLGPENLRFEEALAGRCKRRHAIAVTSGTTALELVMWALDVAEGDEVLVPAFAFPAAAAAIAGRGARPIPIDVDAATWTADLELARAAVSARTRMLLSIDQLGLVAEAAEVESFARDAGLALVSDAACGLGGSDSRGRPGASAGVAATLSFHPRKVITTGEGGAVLTDDDELADALRQLRNQGQISRGRFGRLGTNARLGEIEAAIGCAQLERMDAMLTERRLLAEGYRERLAPLADNGRLSWQNPSPRAMHAYQTFAVLLSPSFDRDEVQQRLADAGIESGPATYAFHRVSSLAELDCVRGQSLPVADALHDRALALPLYLGMRSRELDRVAEALSETLR